MFYFAQQLTLKNFQLWLVVIFGRFYCFEPKQALRGKRLYSEFFWSVISRIWTRYGEIRVSPRIQYECGKIRTIKTPNTDTFYSVRATIPEKNNGKK